MSQSIAKILLDINAVILRPDQPFRYTSGLLSPIYCDNRLLISHPNERNIVINAFLDLIIENKLEFDVVAGTATAGIAHAAWISDRLNKPMVYVRSSAKAHGKGNQIEGEIKPGQRALVVEDLISTGKSAIAATTALREAGAIVNDTIAIFTYQLQSANDAFAGNNINIHTLSNIETLVKTAQQQGLSLEHAKLIHLWQHDPKAWEFNH